MVYFDYKTQQAFLDDIRSLRKLKEIEILRDDASKAYVAGLLTEAELDQVISALADATMGLSGFNKKKFIFDDVIGPVVQFIKSNVGRIVRVMLDKFTPLGLFDLLQKDDESFTHELLFLLPTMGLGAFGGALAALPTPVIVNALVGSGLLRIIRDTAADLVSNAEDYVNDDLAPEWSRKYGKKFIYELPIGDVDLEDLLPSVIASLDDAEEVLETPSAPPGLKQRAKDWIAEKALSILNSNPAKFAAWIIEKTHVVKPFAELSRGEIKKGLQTFLVEWGGFGALGYAISLIGAGPLATLIMSKAAWFPFVTAVDAVTEINDRARLIGLYNK